ncbi:glycosyltransferase [Georgenia sp. AZ-5]|uniref:glycosyltransferase n=1 Tax=Georgenia sp. AZ-5 TaxID=3367526 RepID=UPI0037542677
MTRQRTDPSAKPPGRRLLDTGLLDIEYYSAQCGRKFRTPQEGAEHFARFGMRAGLNCHPLFDLSYFPARFKDWYRAGNVDRVLAYLRSAESRAHRWSPIFDPGELDPEGESRSALLTRFKPRAEAEIPYPARHLGEPLSWPQVRERVVDYARHVYTLSRLRKPLRLSEWDFAREEAWLASLGMKRFVQESDQPAVSVVMPVWNRGETVSTAINSVLNQSLKYWELIIVDDGSSDHTREVVRAYAREDPRVRLIECEHAGVSAARNEGVRQARGRYMAFLDSDNTWRKGFLRRMVAAMDRDALDAAYAGIRMLNDRHEFLGQDLESGQLIQRNFVDMNVLVARTELVRSVGGFDTRIRRWVDHDLVLKISEVADITFLPFIGCDYVDSGDDNRITRSESENWQHVVVDKHVDRYILRSEVGNVPTTGVSFIVRADGNAQRTILTIQSLIESNDVDPAAIILLDDLDGMRESVKLFTALLGVSGLRYWKLPRRYTDAVVWNVGVRATTSDVVFFIAAGTELRRGSVTAMTDRMAITSAIALQPLVVDRGGVVVSAGGFGVGRGPAVSLFEGLTVKDAESAGAREIDSVWPAAFAIDGAALREVGGFRPILAGAGTYGDLIDRLRSTSGRSAWVEPAALAVDRTAKTKDDRAVFDARDLRWLPPQVDHVDSMRSAYGQLDLELTGFHSGADARITPARPVVTWRNGGLDGRRRRWSIKIGAEYSAGGSRWGDVFFAADLAEALERHGESVVIDRFGAFDRPTNYLDDVSLIIRGLHPSYPQPGRVNLIWVISRPDLVTKEELEGFDVVFGASPKWCTYVREHWGIDAIFLPQATNPARFNPARRAESETHFDRIFIGGPRKPVGRRIVADCIAAGMRVDVIGPRWANFVPENWVASKFVSNDEVASVYAAADVVLNDHFEDMAEWGFVNNRLYDAVASGARVLSDAVEQVDEIFGGAVQTYRSVEELRDILADPDAHFPDHASMSELSAMVREQHNFDRRAEAILQAMSR